MPGMFSRSRRGSTNTVRTSSGSNECTKAGDADIQCKPVDRNTAAAASAAAGAAFAQRRPSQASLSSAAAAAALRSLTSSPEPVGNLQTKRMMRRGSVSSVGSGSVIGGPTRGTTGRAALQRQNSGGSMTERTFRSPSPWGRNGAESPAPHAPPVPAIPTSLSSKPRRSSSMDPPQRVLSPTPRGGRGMSVDAAGGASQHATRKPKRLSNVNEGVEPVQTSPNGNRNSINYSRPMASPPASPLGTASTNKYIHGSGGYFAGPTGTGPTSTQKNARTASLVAAGQTASVGQAVQNAANITPSKNKVGQGAAPGSHFARATSTPIKAAPAPVASPAATPTETVMVYDANSRTFRPASKPTEAAVMRSIEPPSPTIPLAAAPPPPGSYDPATRSMVPLSKSAPASTRTGPTAATEETILEPPPRNPARGSPSPSSPRGAPVLKKHPSTVREDREAEEEADIASPHVTTGPSTIQTSAGPAKAYVVPQSSHNRSSSLDVPTRTPNGSGRGRVTSLSPQRSAHFPRSPVVEATRHEPPARDFSPVKSAMKHSPASSVRTASPMANFSPGGNKVAPSDASDTNSLYSQDGMSLMVKKKKNRVSFDEQPREIEPTSTPVSAQPPSLDDDVEDEMMKPRPALPSFGSVRKDRSPEVTRSVTEIFPERQEASTDQAVGRVLFNQSNEDKGTNQHPLAPEVTSKEEAGYASDESDEPTAAQSTPSTVLPVEGDSVPKARDFATETLDRLLGDTSPVVKDEPLPAINLLPPTPGLDEQTKELGDAEGDDKTPRPNSMIGIVVPGGWQDNNDVKSTVQSTPLSAPAAIESSVLEHSPSLQPIDEDSDDSATFSDAAEDLSDLDEGGFASLNAIAVSPIVVTTPVEKSQPNELSSPSSPPESPLAKQADRAAAVQHSQQASGDWTEATAYWSKLSKQQRQQIERDHLSSDDENVIVQKSRKKKSILKQTDFLAASTGAALKPANPKPVGMKRSLRGSAGATPAAPTQAAGDSDVHMRRSMRSGTSASGNMPTSLRNASSPQRRPQSVQVQPGGTSNRSNTRPTSAVSLPHANAHLDTRPESPLSQQSAFPVLGSQNPSRQQQPRPAPMIPSNSYTAKIQEKYANDSDSESSFKKAKRKQNNVSAMDSRNTSSMKRSMRSGSIDSSAPAYEPRPISPTPNSKGKTFSIRSLSPTGSLFGRRKQESIRETLRGGPAESGPKRTTLRSNPPATKSRTAASGPSRSVPAAAPTRRFKSRFADSDDEDDADNGKRGGFFGSRFAESDDDMPSSPAFIAADLRPVRGIPRKQGQNDGDSTDLEEEEDEDERRKNSRKRTKQAKPIVPDPADVERAMEAARRKLGIAAPDATPPTSQATNQGSALGQGSLRVNTTLADKPEPKSRLEDVQINGTPKKRGFMGSILRRNRASSQSVVQVGSNGQVPETPSSPVPPLPGTPVTAPDQSQPMSSAASPASPSQGKLVRRNSAQPKPKPIRGNSWMSTATAPVTMPDSPSNLPSKTELDSWPLPSPPPGGKTYANGTANERPYTSAGITSASAVQLSQPTRPDFRQRSQSGTDVGGRMSSRRSVRINAGPGIDEESVIDGEGGNGSNARSGKKKRFPMLRRAFGLND
nr:hypothetical protein CFP56_36192 [Quercus suber]